MGADRQRGSRRLVHTRHVQVETFELENGNYSIEGRVTDVKTDAHSNLWRGVIPPGEALHDMSIRMTLSPEMTVLDIEAFSDKNPYLKICSAAAANFRGLTGFQLGPGWTKTVRLIAGGANGCTHLTELLTGPMATTAYISIFLDQKQKRDALQLATNDKPGFIDTCRALQADGEVIKTDYPQFAEVEPSPETDMT